LRNDASRAAFLTLSLRFASSIAFSGFFGEIASWYDARNFEEEKAAARRINKVTLDNVVYARLA
jgi:hypothetical protein